MLARVENQKIPILYAFLPSKSNEAYTEVFKVVRAMVGDRKVSLNIDLEQAVIKSIKEIFPGQCKIHLCFFYLRQTIDRKMEDLGIKRMLKKDDYKLLHSYFSNLAYIPEQFVEETFKNFVIPLIQFWTLMPKEKGEKLIQYFG